MRQGTRSSRKRRGGRRGAKAPTVARLAEQKLIESRVHPLWCEEYGPDGEIVRVAEWAPMPRPKPMILRISCTDYAPKKTDWRERGVVPPGGIHPWDEEAARLRWGLAGQGSRTPPAAGRREGSRVRPGGSPRVEETRTAEGRE